MRPTRRARRRDVPPDEQVAVLRRASPGGEAGAGNGGGKLGPDRHLHAAGVAIERGEKQQDLWAKRARMSVMAGEAGGISKGDRFVERLFFSQIFLPRSQGRN